MIEFLETLDRYIVVTINSWHSPFLDELMWWISSRITWIPLYIILIYLAYRRLKFSQFIFFILLAILSVAIADLVSVHLFKNLIQRYRPSHNLLILDQLHYYRMKSGDWYRGGEYGFISSHASNYFAVAGSVFFVLRKDYPKLKWWLLGIGILICYSRVYLGVHYFSDVLAGALVGSLISFILYKFWYLSVSKK
jgi:undecaprenyl-diphosphatase